MMSPQRERVLAMRARAVEDGKRIIFAAEEDERSLADRALE
jgi:hypothetical protein